MSGYSMTPSEIKALKDAAEDVLAGVETLLDPDIVMGTRDQEHFMMALRRRADALHRGLDHTKRECGSCQRETYITERCPECRDYFCPGECLDHQGENESDHAGLDEPADSTVPS